MGTVGNKSEIAGNGINDYNANTIKYIDNYIFEHKNELFLFTKDVANIISNYGGLYEDKIYAENVIDLITNFRKSDFYKKYKTYTTGMKRQQISFFSHIYDNALRIYLIDRYSDIIDLI